MKKIVFIVLISVFLSSCGVKGPPIAPEDVKKKQNAKIEKQ